MYAALPHSSMTASLFLRPFLTVAPAPLQRKHVYFFLRQWHTITEAALLRYQTTQSTDTDIACNSWFHLPPNFVPTKTSQHRSRFRLHLFTKNICVCFQLLRSVISNGILSLLLLIVPKNA